MLKRLLKTQASQADLAMTFLQRSRPRATWTLITEGGRAPAVASFQPSIAVEVAAARTWIVAAQRKGHGVQHLIGETATPLHRPMTEEEIVASSAIAISIPGTPAEQQTKMRLIPVPTALINTGKEITALYALSARIPMAVVQQIGKAMAHRVGGKLVWLIPLPGTIRNNGHRVAIIQHDPARILAPADLAPPARPNARRVIRADKVAPAPIAWLWRYAIPKGELTIIGGKGSAGKTTLCLGLAAIVTQGAAWPDGTQAPKGRALVIEGEDDAETMTVPRLMAAGADLSRVTLVSQSKDILTARDLEECSAGLDELQLVVLSPLRRLIRDNQTTNDEIRARLEPLVAWARARGVGMIGVMHPQKGSKERTADALAGSPAYSELSRMVHMAGFDETDDEPDEALKRRSLTVPKTNIAPPGLRHLYRIEKAWVGEIETSRVVWVTPGTEVAAPRAAPAAPPPAIHKTTVQAWLAAKLADGPVQGSAIEKWAGESGISRASLFRAAKALQVIRTATTGDGKAWQLCHSDGKRCDQ